MGWMRLWWCEWRGRWRRWWWCVGAPQCRQPLLPLDPREGSTHPAAMPSAQGERHEERGTRGVSERNES